MAAQQNLIADGVAGQIDLIDGVGAVIILRRHTVALFQPLSRQFIQQNHRTELLGISHQHQTAAPQNGHQRHRIHDHHVKHGFRFPQTVSGNTGGGNDGKDLLQPQQVLFLPQISGKGLCRLVQILLPQNLPQLVKLLGLQLFYTARPGVVEIFFQLLHISVHQRHGLFFRHRTRVCQTFLNLPKLPAAKVRLEGKHLGRHFPAVLIFQHALNGFPALPVVQNVVIFFQKLR